MPTVLITGANKGFGFELLSVFASRGWTVFPLIRRKTDADKLISTFKPQCFPIVADVTSDSVGTAISNALEQQQTPLDLLINNAGSIKKKRGIMETTPDDVIDHFNVHCIGVLRCVKAALPYLKKAKGPIVINITSRWGSINRTVAGKGGLIYSYQIAKCAQNMLTACLNQDPATDNIKVFGIHPGRLKTSVAAPDADTDPRDAAEKLYEWIGQADESRGCEFYDLISGDTIDW
jgi:NAD(P)-dependent dehydrogenase (short-subunit alcohol dehydrogenase family)